MILDIDFLTITKQHILEPETKRWNHITVYIYPLGSELGHNKGLNKKRYKLKCDRREQDHPSLPGNNKAKRDTSKV